MFFTPHSLHVPEIIILLAALGLILNACITFYISRKQLSQLIPIRDEIWMKQFAIAKKRDFHE